MGETMLIEVPSELAQSARKAAEQSHRQVQDVLIEWMSKGSTDTPVRQLSDDQVLALRELEMDEAQQSELSDLLADQNAGTLDDEGRIRLTELMQVYRNVLARKSEAMRVAFERGLPPLV